MEAFSKRGIERLRHFRPVVEHLMRRQWDAEPLGAREGASRGSPSFLTLDEALRRGEFRSLSAREREIVALILKGHSSKSVAEHLGIAVGTVKNHRKSIYRRLAISSQSALFSRFLRSIGLRSSGVAGAVGEVWARTDMRAPRGHGQIRMATLQ